MRPGITISIQDSDFWEESITIGEGRFKDEITLEQLYQAFKERLEAEGGKDGEEKGNRHTKS